MAQGLLNAFVDWLIKCIMYFVPILLMLARYNSFLLHYKKPMVDIIVDGQFCIIPFCLALESMLSFLRNWQEIGGNVRTLGVFFFICLFIIAIVLLLIYWDLSYVNVQKEGLMTSKDKMTMKNIIVFTLAAVLILSFCIEVVIC
ncbi:MAG: hypothetical protein NC392_06310 [Roseburia sp.]|nr:hypothetical protein [Roseburia sp.]MCM1202091.1 hypothetical protein [Bacteroides fragilis]